ncbi:uroporphyrinogen-III C-methyltransferase [Plantactinospora soyae]|uniref:Uroporphyrin-III C-methyltransferase/precorrin-2 dehydrogenase/sirohydrochlorin ferrochelatase n=1 Tax=Plantactinospora soyae TaxID=1544732 RepID=A0A927QWK2_9ACTN|nr:uroporphyrinogen-III C-methyltransferase [Plantactinospora soyae]MBE1484528.1 uroporphyrin-III C-methyltransferase/precorrin-2 dehydrogenase/sirohydrochlorin ferrochelatase [Plantactinospora soyae]
MTLYPLALRLDGRRVLVVGGGAVATRRVPALLEARARVVLVAPELTPALQAHVDAGRLEWVARRFEPADVDGAWLVQVAVDDPAAAEAVSDAALARQVFCVRADDRAAATAWTPAVTRYGAVTVAVLGGGDPRRAVVVRDAIREGLIDGTLPGSGPAPRNGPDPDGTFDGAMDGVPDGTVEDGATPDGIPPNGAGSASASAEGAVRPVGRVALVGAGPGDPELITIRGRRLLAEADVVVADRLVPGLLLDELRPEVELVDATKIPHGPAAAQEEINRVLVDRALAGARVVRLKGGDPYVFGRGGEEALACAAAGVPVTVVPGVTSSIAAPAAAGVPVTHRGVAHEFTVVSGHLPPDHPDSLVDWSALARLRGTLVVLMGLNNLPAITAALRSYGRSPQTPAAVVQEGTTGGQRVVRSTLDAVAADARAAGFRPPAVVVFGDVVNTLAKLPGNA